MIEWFEQAVHAGELDRLWALSCLWDAYWGDPGPRPSMCDGRGYTDAQRVALRKIVATSGVDPRTQAIVLVLALCTQDPEPRLRWSACDTLGRIGPEARAALPLLMRASRDDDPQVAIVASTAVWRVTGDTDYATMRLGSFLHAEDPEVLLAAIRQLCSLAPASAVCLPALRDLASSPDHAVSQASQRAVSQIELVESKGWDAYRQEIIDWLERGR